MTDQNSRIIPPGQPGSPFFEPSGSMRGPGDDIEPFPGFVGVRCDGGTDPTILASAIASRLAALDKDFPADRFDRYTFVITDGEPPASLHESHGDVLSVLIANLKPGESLVCLDEPGAVSGDVLSCAAPRVVSGNGLLPVPAASELVARICDTVDGEAQPARTDQCSGCGGCDKK